MESPDSFFGTGIAYAWICGNLNDVRAVHGPRYDDNLYETTGRMGRFTVSFRPEEGAENTGAHRLPRLMFEIEPLG